ncbi:sensor histidine kinase [Metabacillus malikii]|uniref:Two-component system sensor histidine kinase YesM n=1 Tax=Metabacillus malikii TaxID=1504265 RepID=A0ABT9ZGT1_9BACI|nr:sensor histidine kinase [Metabacillus malikii]MDQ0231180.1 two-component system sensor histidine kinase YesM [Metabacillus malikii]
MKKYKFNNLSIRNKLLIIYICSVFIPITLTHSVFYQVTYNNVRTQKMNDFSLSIKQISNDFQVAIDDAVGISSKLYTTYELYNLLEAKYLSSIDFIHAYYDYFGDISTEVSLYPSVHSIKLYTNNDTVIYAGGINKIDTLVKESEWYKESESVRSSYPVLTRRIGDSGKYNTFSLIREMDYYLTKNSTQKILEIELEAGIMNSIFKDVTFPGDLYLLNGEGTIEYTTNPEISWSEDKYSFESVTLPKDKVMFHETYDLPYLNDWKVIGVTEEHVLLEDIKESRNIIFYIALINLLFPSIFIIYITSSLHLRILHILKHMRKVEDQNFELIEGIDYQDEIGELTQAFNRMASKIKRLINEVYVVDIQKKDLELQRKQAQLSALQSQINPHFLFNVLETIRMRSILKQEDETAKIIENIANMLRKSFIWGKDWVTVDEEIFLIKCFLEIQHYRFDDKMQYQIDIDQDAAKCFIPNMSLIPFVENASIHGIEPAKGKGMINISIKRIGEFLLCEISDNGQGMEKEVYEQVMESLEKEQNIGEHVGVKNVYYRLKLHYSNKFDFKIESEKGVGTTIRIKLPIIKDKINSIK